MRIACQVTARAEISPQHISKLWATALLRLGYPPKALSDVVLIIEKWPKSSNKTRKITSRRPQRCLSARRLGVMFPRRSRPVKAPSPLLPAKTRPPLISPTLPIVLGATSRRPVPSVHVRLTRPIGSIFRRGAGAPIWHPSDRIHKTSDYRSHSVLPARLNGASRPTLSPRSSAAFPPYRGIMCSTGSP